MRRLYVDIETAPMVVYTWRVGRNINLGHDNIIKEPSIICIGYKWEGKPTKAMWWDKRNDDKAMLSDFVKIIGQADEVIAHNGDRFDLPWIRTRCLFHRIPIEAQLPSVDTLKQARRGFNFPSNRLDYLGQYMGLGGKRKTSGFDLWKQVYHGDRSALRQMVDYCKRDVELLEEVHHTLYTYAKPTAHVGVMEGGYKHWCPSCGSGHTKLNGNKWTTAGGTVKVQMMCLDCGRTWRMGEATARAEMLREYKAKKAAEGLV